ncbi:MAG: tetratricopeptide repeat protein, partial [Kiritimatiellia bacterium]|nr:tetratricopeptide repeat protein [Kiritimatiellia bacterium]
MKKPYRLRRVLGTMLLAGFVFASGVLAADPEAPEDAARSLQEAQERIQRLEAERDQALAAAAAAEKRALNAPIPASRPTARKTSGSKGWFFGLFGGGDEQDASGQPKSPSEAAALDAAQSLLTAGEADQAYLRTQEILAANPRDLEALALLGRIETTRGRLAEAIVALETAARRAPRQTGYKKDLALAFFAAGRLDNAIEEYKKVVEIDKRDGESCFNLAALYLMLPRPDKKEAATFYERALRLGEPRDE